MPKLIRQLYICIKKWGSLEMLNEEVGLCIEGDDKPMLWWKNDWAKRRKVLINGHNITQAMKGKYNDL